MKKLIVIAGLVLASVIACTDPHADEIIYEINENDVNPETNYTSKNNTGQSGDYEECIWYYVGMEKWANEYRFQNSGGELTPFKSYRYEGVRLNEDGDIVYDVSSSQPFNGKGAFRFNEDGSKTVILARLWANTVGPYFHFDSNGDIWMKGWGAIVPGNTDWIYDLQYPTYFQECDYTFMRSVNLIIEQESPCRWVENIDDDGNAGLVCSDVYIYQQYWDHDWPSYKITFIFKQDSNFAETTEGNQLPEYVEGDKQPSDEAPTNINLDYDGANGSVIDNVAFTATRHNLGESHIPGNDEHVIEVFMTGDNLPDNLEATADFYFGENAYDPGAYSGTATFVQVDGGYVAQYRYYDQTDDLDWIIKVNVFGQTYEVDLD